MPRMPNLPLAVSARLLKWNCGPGLVNAGPPFTSPSAYTPGTLVSRYSFTGMNPRCQVRCRESLPRVRKRAQETASARDASRHHSR